MKIIGVAGGSGSGKTTFARMLAAKLGSDRSVILAQDSYYKDQSHRFDRDGGRVNFDHPDSIDWPLLIEHLVALRMGRFVEVPTYDFATHRRLPEIQKVNPHDFIIVDGILVFTQKNLLELLDHKIFIDCPESLRFERRLRRDVIERGRTEEGVKAQFFNQVKPMHDEFVEPSKTVADEIIRGDENYAAPLEHVVNQIIG